MILRLKINLTKSLFLVVLADLMCISEWKGWSILLFGFLLVVPLASRGVARKDVFSLVLISAFTITTRRGSPHHTASD